MTEIIDDHYSDKDFSFFIRVFDKIVESKASLDFNIDHWAPTFLSLVAMKGSQQLLDHFLRKGAKINFIGDMLAHENEAVLGTNYPEIERYSTCLDFLQLKFSDALTVNYNYIATTHEENAISRQDVDSQELVSIKKREYCDLVEQLHYLRDLVRTASLIDYAKSVGGNTYAELTSAWRSLSRLSSTIAESISTGSSNLPGECTRGDDNVRQCSI